MLRMIDTPPHKIVFLGPGCSVATVPVAEAAPYWQAVQVNSSNVFFFSLANITRRKIFLHLPLFNLGRKRNTVHASKIFIK